MIESLTNNKIKYTTKLKLKKYRTENHQFLVEGEHLIEEAIKSNLVDYIFTTKDTDYDVPSYRVSEKVMKKLSDLNLSEVAVCNKPKTIKQSDRILILDGVQDPGNLGTLIRSAAAFGFNTILYENTVDCYNEKVIRSSQGALFYVNLIEVDLIEFMKANKEIHYYGTNVQNGNNLKAIKFNQDKLAIILGNEGFGVRKSIQDLVNTNINIPMLDTESLNVGVAGGILMYQAFGNQ